MATATAPAIPRVVLQDRWDALMIWERNGGNSTAEYVDLADALGKLVDAVAGHHETEDVMDDDFLFSIGEVVIDSIERLGIAR